MMSEQSVRVPVDNLVGFMKEALVAMGIPTEDANIIADVVITSDLWGITSHGIAHLKMYHERIKSGLQLPVTRWDVVKETPTTAVVDGGNGMGMVVGFNAMKIAIEKARQYGLGAVAVRNSSHYGVAGYYPRMALSEGMVGLSMTNAHPSIAPTFGVAPLLGTNPIAVAVPTDEPFPFLFDAATAVVTRGKIEVAARANKPIPAGWVVSREGDPVTDTRTLIEQMNKDQAALMPIGGIGELMGGHKGYGLATMVEIFSAAFQKGAYLADLHDTDAQGNRHFLRIGHFFMAINIENFLPVEEFKSITGDMMRQLRASPKTPDQARIYTAGEKEYYNALFVQEHGVEITPGVQRGLKSLVEELHLPDNDLGF
jgi:LDH2 family malate/lactate/ureidoglycolate dehydrogenase